ncbi:MAG: hypothetical protein COA71_09510 [SAR86 cluster bacterium]|uniref:Basal-body rod modification protein FlgD n=1 Tax=SAR86 cluster bacterium TaxID=2030880 RepID=A0A2A5CBM2_9GAMM|nr:MAG: hypothetical protein COA71_09510 [SAR86 cluster bacterium]
MNVIDQIFGPTTNSTSSNSSKELGQEDFLKLLVAQLKNQDPSNPADNGEFLGQIAQFSMVDGIDELGESFKSISNSFFTNQAMQASQLVNKEVLTESDNTILTEGQGIQGKLFLNDHAANVKLQIHDAAGSLVRTIDLDSLEAGEQTFSWNGLDDEAKQLPAGSYTFSAEGLLNGELKALSTHLYSAVESVAVDRSNTSILLNLANGEQVDFSQITEYR